ncbi:hypothetical protein N7520_009546 [Penicillium odoratum]|uniref:uncharacterized protein n=1 Tax=Penicillium odoratum TaxID=1167516 RepID=UPI0025467F85|nr:uncharacterized protein N7520_009546 [Penicillium odoratum]KAJ5752629.1 hypothetical protein N7520_009546 [Penicillium odoratum]
MDRFSSPFSPIQTTRPSTSDTSSPPSSRTTSPPSSPTFTFRRRERANRNQSSPHHLFNLSFQQHQTSHPQEDHHSTSSHGHPHAVSVLPCAVLRGRSSLMVVRRRPSAVDMALSEERSRCDEDVIERQGLDLMEPRPVEMKIDMNASLALHAHSHGQMGSGLSGNERRGSGSGSGSGNIVFQQPQPRFVMGGIFEVMEGRA